MKLLFSLSVSIMAAASMAMAQDKGPTAWTAADLLRPSRTGVAIQGNPRTIDSPYGKAVYFDGDSDIVFINANPVEGLTRFTVEAIFRPDSTGPFEQRFLHIGTMQDRVMLETRTTADHRWYFDAFVKTNALGCTLIDKEKLHAAGTWHHVAFVIDEGRLTTYVDGAMELADTVVFVPIRGGKTAIGARQNNVSWFKGAIYAIRITPAALTPGSFLWPASGTRLRE